MGHRGMAYATPGALRPHWCLLLLAACTNGPATLEDANEWVLGEWTAASSQSGAESEPGYWEYLRFGDDGQVVQCTAMGSDVTWSGCEQTAYEVSASRYADTGEDYFRIRLRYNGGWSMVAYVIDGAVIQQRITQDGGISYMRSVDFRRGNLHPHAASP